MELPRAYHGELEALQQEVSAAGPSDFTRWTAALARRERLFVGYPDHYEHSQIERLRALIRAEARARRTR